MTRKEPEVPSYSSDNLRWLRRQIGSAVSEADFDQVELDIDYDIFEEEPWTLDPVRVTIIKNLLERKKNEFKLTKAGDGEEE